MPAGTHAWAPNLIALSDGRFFLSFAYGVEGSWAGLAYVQSDGDGRSWSAPTVFYDSANNYDSKPSVAQLNDGTLICIFFQGPIYNNERHQWGNRDLFALRLIPAEGGNSWRTAPGLIPVYTDPLTADCWAATLKLADGSLWAAFTSSRDLSFDGLDDLQIKAVNSLNEDGTLWGEVGTISADTGSETWPALAQRRDGTILSVWDSDAWMPAQGRVYRLWQKIKRDVAVPIITGVTPSGEILTADAILVVNYEDRGAGISLDGQPLANCQAGPNTISCLASELTYGPHQIDGSVADKAGNVATISGAFTVGDGQAPVISGRLPSGAVNSGQPVISASLSDQAPSSGVAPESLLLEVDGVDVTAGASKTGSEVSYLPQTELAAGHHSVHLAAADVAGNRGSSDWSFNVAPHRSYFSWYNGIAASDWVLMANPVGAAHEAWFNLYLAGVEQGIAPLSGLLAGQAPAGSVLIASYPGQRQGPLWATHSSPALISQHIHWKQSLEEVVGFDSARLTDHYWWSWYDDSATPGMLNWVLVANPNSYRVDYQIRVAGELKESGTLESAGSRDPQNRPLDIVTPRFAGLRGGPVEGYQLSQRHYR